VVDAFYFKNLELILELFVEIGSPDPVNVFYVG
jgi:hypothetical protein